MTEVKIHEYRDYNRFVQDWEDNDELPAVGRDAVQRVVCGAVMAGPQ